MANNSSTYDVVIVGAGIVGAQMAYRLAKAQRKVLLIEAGESIPNVGQSFPVKQDNLDKVTGLKKLFNIKTHYLETLF